MSKSSRSHFMTTFRKRAAIQGEPTRISGEQGVAFATVRSGISVGVVLVGAQPKGRS